MKFIIAVVFTGLFLVVHFSLAKVEPDIKTEIQQENTLIENSNQKKELLRETEPSYGQLLYENHCLDCHESRMHIRANTQAKSLGQLSGYVRIRAVDQGLKWGEEEITAVTLYLNQIYYHFSVSQLD